jgi:hypothetical protein
LPELQFNWEVAIAYFGALLAGNGCVPMYNLIDGGGGAAKRSILCQVGCV